MSKANGHDDLRQLAFSFHSQVIPNGDGSFTIRPGRPVPGRVKLTVAEAADFAGVSADTILRLYDAGFIEGERLTPRTTKIFEDSLIEHMRKSRDREFWERRQNSQLYLAQI